MKCDGLRPICTQCLKADRGSECQYHEKQHISRTQILQQKVAKLEARLRELESDPTGPSGVASSSAAPTLAPGPSNRQDDQDTIFLSAPASVSANSEWNLDLSILDESPSAAPLSSSSPLFDVPGIWPNNTIQLSPPMEGSPVQSAAGDPSTALPNWWESDSTTFCNDKRKLLEIFLVHRHQCSFDVHVGRLRSSLEDPCMPRPHPALLDAIYLLGCYFSRSPHLTELEPYFLKRALKGISVALHHQDRVVHVLQASCLISVYFYCHGRILEAYYHSSTSARLAIDLGLHQLRPIDFELVIQSLSGGLQDSANPSGAIFPLPCPQDTIEHAERVAAFWQIFVVDRAWSVATGLPSALPDDDHPRMQIETAWPMGVTAAPSGNETDPVPYGYDMSGGIFTAPTVNLRAKAVMLFERTARFATVSSSDTSRWTEQRSLEMSLAQFAANLPEISKHTSQDTPLRLDVEIVDIYMLIYVATIHLHKEFIETQTTSFEKCLTSANSVTAIVRQLNEDDYGFLDPITSTCWRYVADVYLRIMTADQLPPEQCDLIAICDELRILIASFKRLAFYCPIADTHVSSLEQNPFLSVFL